jgi:hypothetical protein
VHQSIRRIGGIDQAADRIHVNRAAARRHGCDFCIRLPVDHGHGLIAQICHKDEIRKNVDRNAERIVPVATFATGCKSNRFTSPTVDGPNVSLVR